MNKNINIVGGGNKRQKYNPTGSLYMTIDEIVKHNSHFVKVLKIKNKYWNCLKVPVAEVADQIEIKTDRLGHECMCGWKYKGSKLTTDIVVILPYSTKWGITAVYHEGEYEYL
jgi:hypothetical protein